MPKTYEPIASTTLSAGTATVTFSSIPQTYTDLIVVLYAGVSVDSNIIMQLNSDTGSNYSRTMLAGNGSAASSTRSSNQTSMRLDENSFIGTTTGNSNLIIHLMNYSNTTTNKTVLARSNNAGVGTSLGAFLWRSNSAISTILLSVASNTFNTNSMFTLYGIKAA